MGIYGELIGYDNLEIISPYQIQQLSELKMVRRVNCHTELCYTGIIPEEQKDSYIQTATAQDCIAVNWVDASGARQPLFKGITANIGVKTIRGIYYLEVEGHSHTAQLDFKLRDRSFQDKDLKYTDLLNQIISAYSGGGIHNQAGNEAILSQFTLQYNETDWQLLQRLAARFNTFLIPDDLSDKPQLYFGLPGEKSSEINFSADLPYRIGKSLDTYADLSENHLQSVTATGFTYFIVENGQFYPLGTKVKFKGVKLVVAQCTAELKNGSLIYEYHLYPSDGLKQKPIYNRQITGASLKGKVIDTSKDMVRVHLDIDQQQEKHTAWWFPYESFYTAEGNSGFYCMPQLGDYVRIYFPTPKEAEAIALNSVRKDKESSPKTQDPGVKYWGTNHGKELMLGGEELSLTAKNQQEGQIQIKLHDEQGIEIRSDTEIYLAARKNLVLELDRKAAIKAKAEVQLICGDSSIDMDGITHLKGVEVSFEPQK